MNKHVAKSLEQTRMLALVACVAMIATFAMSFMAEPLDHEAIISAHSTILGYKTILGYNRDFLVNGRWWFFAGMILTFASAIRCSLLLVSQKS